MPFYQDSSGNYHDGYDPSGKSNYNYTDTKGNYVNNTPSSGSSSGGSSGGYMNIPKATVPAPVAPAVDYNKMLAQALAKQQADFLSQQKAAEDARIAAQQAAQQAAEKARIDAEQAAAAKKQGYINTQTGLYNNYFNDQQNSQLAALRNARETALQGYNGTERVAQQTAYNNSNQVDAQHAQSAQRLKEIMAANGLLSSGDNVTQNLQLENQRQNALYDINQSKGNLLQDIAEKRSLVNNQAASQEQGLANQISADKTRALIDLQQYGDQKETDLTKFNYGTYVDSINRDIQQQQFDTQTKLNEANLTGQYNGSQTLAALNSARQDALQRAGLTGSLDGQATLAGRGQAFDQQMGIADRTGMMPDGMKTLAAQQLDRQNKNDNINLAQWLTQTYGINAAPKNDAGVAFNQVNGQQTLAAQQQALQNRQANLGAALQVGNAAGRLISPQSDWGNLFANAGNSPMNFQGKQEDWNQWLQKQQLGVSQGNLGVQQGRLSWDKDPTNPDNITRNLSNQKYQDEQGAKALESEIYNHATEFKTAQDVEDYFKANGAYIASKVGANDVSKLKQSFMAQFAANAKQDNSTYNKAISLAQKDSRWFDPSSDKQALIQEYQGILGNQ